MQTEAPPLSPAAENQVKTPFSPSAARDDVLNDRTWMQTDLEYSSLIMCLFQSPTADVTKKKPEKKKKKKKEKDAVTETGRSSIKTSSLFKHNPDIPAIHRYIAPPLICWCSWCHCFLQSSLVLTHIFCPSFPTFPPSFPFVLPLLLSFQTSCFSGEGEDFHHWILLRPPTAPSPGNTHLDVSSLSLILWMKRLKTFTLLTHNIHVHHQCTVCDLIGCILPPGGDTEQSPECFHTDQVSLHTCFYYLWGSGLPVSPVSWASISTSILTVKADFCSSYEKCLCAVNFWRQRDEDSLSLYRQTTSQCWFSVKPSNQQPFLCFRCESVFSVQKQTIPALLSGRDAVVRSQTGSGETLYLNPTKLSPKPNLISDESPAVTARLQRRCLFFKT